MDNSALMPIYFTSLGIIGLIALLLNYFPKKTPTPTNIDAFENIADPALCVDAGLKITHINKKARDLLKLTKPNISNLPLAQITTPDVSQILENQFPLQPTKITINDTNNNPIQTFLKIKKVTTDNNILLGYAILILPIDYQPESKSLDLSIEQKKTEIQNLQKHLNELQNHTNSINPIQQLSKSENQTLKQAINNLSLGFILIDQYQNIILNNQEALNIFPTIDTKSQNLKSLEQNEQIGTQLMPLVEEALTQNKKVKKADIEINLKYTNLAITPIITNQNNNKVENGCVILLEDNTVQHELEISKQDLFSIASHELRTPLTAIYGYTSLIKQIYFQDLQNPELRRIINSIGTLSQKLSQSVNNFLDASRLEQGRIQIKKEPCDLYQILSSTIKTNEKAALEKNLYIKFDSPQTPITVYGDLARLRQIINIILNNAIKFTQNGGIYIDTEILPDMAKIKIRDTGIGIPEENQKLLFSKFQQVEENLLTRQEGTGLGLHIAKLLIEKMGGQIKLEQTSPNQGSLFSFTIPTKNI